MGMPGSGMGQPNSVLAPSSSGYIGVHSVQAISNPSYSGAATSQSFSSPASVAGMQVMGLVELIGLYCDIATCLCNYTCTVFLYCYWCQLKIVCADSEMLVNTQYSTSSCHAFLRICISRMRKEFLLTHILHS